MTFDRFNQLVDNTMTEINSITEHKGREYAHSEDRFANFNRLAPRLNISREKVLWVYLTKHLDSIESFVQNTGNYRGSEAIHGRILDAIVYLLLLDGMIFENENEKEEK